MNHRTRNKPVSCRSHRAKVDNKPRNVLRRMRIRAFGAGIGIAVAGAFFGPVGAALGAIGAELVTAGSALTGALLAEKLFSRSR